MAKKKALVMRKRLVVRLFEELGFKTAKKWDVKRLQAKVKNLPELTDGVKIKHPKVRRILKAILDAGSLVIKSDDDEQQVESTKKAAKKTTKKAKKVSKKKKAAKKEAGKLGVIMSVLEFIRSDGPISEKQILAKLKKRFPDRDPESMGRSIPKVPSYLATNKGINVVKKNNKGQYCIKR